jgi:D-3-phosphoglycerate dehydrogenase
MTHRVLVATALSEAGIDLLRSEVGGLATIIYPEQILTSSALTTAEALIIRDEVRVDTQLLDAAPRLRVIGRAGADIAGIDIDAATRRGIVVMNTPGINAISAAEHTLALMLALTRHIVLAHNALTDGHWQRDTFTGQQLFQKTLGIIGFGRVGREVARRALAFGMNILAYDPYIQERQIEGFQVKLVGLNDLLSQSDIISLHSAFSPETMGLLNRQTLSRVKPGALLVNTAHGDMVEEEALLNTLDSQQLAGAAVDVFAEEPLTNSRLLSHPRILHTPHIGDNTREAQRELGLHIVRQVIDALRGEDFRHAINLPFMDDQPFEAIQPYLKLAERIGILHYHLAAGDIQRVMLEIKGDEFEGLVKPMTVALLNGLLSPMLGDRVNYINAPLLAQEHNIFVTQGKGLNSYHYNNLLSCKTEWSGGNLVIAGALFNRLDPHIVRVNQYTTDFHPDGVMLIIGSYDIPGVIGRVGLLLAENNINIASWQTGRAEPGGNTLSVLTLDEPVDDTILDTLRAQEYIRHVTQIII